jgi:tetratricopeptide (TPR) repeat protein
LENFDKALSIDTEAVYNYYFKGLAYEEAGHPEKAASLYSKYLASPLQDAKLALEAQTRLKALTH